MTRLLFLFAFAVGAPSLSLAETEPKKQPADAAASRALSTAPADRVLGTVQPEIRLADGRVFKNAKILSVTVPRETATLSDGNQIRVVPLADLPQPLRDRAIAEAARAETLRYNVYREVRPPPPPPDRVIPPAPPVVPVATLTIMDQLIAQATKEAPDELKLHLLKTGERVASLTTKIRKAEQIPGWPKIRVSGDAAFAMWDGYRGDYVWRAEKFDVEFAIVSGGTALKLDTITFGGISRAPDVDFSR